MRRHGADGSSGVFDRSLIGHRSAPSVVRVTTEQLKFFAKATNQRDPIYFDETAARAAGHRTIPVPLTFAYSLARACPEQAGFSLRQINADIRHLLHGEQGFRYHSLLYAEDEVSITTQILDFYEKKGGTLGFVVQRTELVNQVGVLCIESNSTFVLRFVQEAS